MKQLLALFSLTFLCAITACEMENTDHTKEIAQMEDSVFTNFPSVNRVSIKVATDFGKQITITMGDKQLFNATEEEREKVVDRTKDIIKNIFKERTPHSGEIVFVENENKVATDEDPAKNYHVVLKDEEDE